MSIPEITKAVQEEDVERVKELIVKGCDVNESNEEFLPPLAYAQYDTYRLLIDAGANIMFTQKEGDGKVINLIIHNKMLSDDVCAKEFIAYYLVTGVYKHKLTPYDLYDMIEQMSNVTLYEGKAEMCRYLLARKVPIMKVMKEIMDSFYEDANDNPAEILDFLLSQLPSSIVFKCIEEGYHKNGICLSEEGDEVKYYIILKVLLEKAFRFTRSVKIELPYWCTGKEYYIKVLELLYSYGTTLSCDNLTGLLAYMIDKEDAVHNSEEMLALIRCMVSMGVSVYEEDKNGTVSSPWSIINLS